MISPLFFDRISYLFEIKNDVLKIFAEDLKLDASFPYEIDSEYSYTKIATNLLTYFSSLDVFDNPALDFKYKKVIRVFPNNKQFININNNDFVKFIQVLLYSYILNCPCKISTCNKNNYDSFNKVITHFKINK